MSIPKPRSIISMDVGKKRIGLAGCDSLGITVTSLPALRRRNYDQDLDLIRLYCKDRKVEGIIVGIPLDENGFHTKQANFCKMYGQKIAKSLNLPIAFVNEHSSTWAAAEKHNLHNDRSGKLDSAAAALLLEQWLMEGPELKPVNTASHSARQVNGDARS